MRIKFRLILALFFIFSFSAGAVEIIEGRVVGVHDGDTITLLMTDHQQVKVRLAQIDAPEIGQAFGQRSKQALSDLVFNKSVEVKGNHRQIWTDSRHALFGRY